MFTAATLAERIRTRFFNEAGDLESLMAAEVASSHLSGEEHETLALQVRDHLEGLGVLQPFLDDPAIEEIWINGRHAEVRLSSMWAPPVVSDFFPASLRISATARSQVFIH